MQAVEIDAMRSYFARRRRSSWRAVLFVLIPLLSIIAGAVYLGERAGLYVPHTNFFLHADSGEGFRRGMAIKLSGFKIGYVGDIALDDTNAIVWVRFFVEDKYAKYLTADSHLTIVRENIIGDAVLEVVRGKGDAAPVVPGGEMRFARGTDMQSTVEQLVDKVIPITKEANDFVRYLNDDAGGLRQTVEESRRLMVALRATNDEVVQLLRQVDGQVTQIGGRTDRLIESADRQIAGEVAASIRTINRDLPAIIKSVAAITENLNRSTAAVDKILAKSGTKIEKTVENGRKTSEDAKALVGGVLSTWPFNGMVEKPKPGLVPFGSHD